MIDIADQERVWVVPEIAALLRVSQMTIRRRITSGDIPGFRCGRGHRVRESVLHAYLAKIGFTQS